MSRLHLKGTPDFSFLDDKRVREYREFINNMLSSYKDYPDKVKVLKEIWEDLKNESADRIADMPEVQKDTLKTFKKTLLRNRKLRT